MTNTVEEKMKIFHTDVSKIAAEEVESGLDGLKERVRQRVIDMLGINNNKLPERIQTWVHQICLPYTAGTQVPVFTDKLAKPIYVESLPNRYT